MAEDNVKASGAEVVKKPIIDEALNTKGFLAFLAKHPNAKEFDVNDEEQVLKRFESFKDVEGVKTSIKEIYSKQIESEMGVKIDSVDITELGNHYDRLAINDPDELKRIKEKIHLFKTLPVEITAIEKEIIKVGTVDELEKKIKEFDTEQKAINETKVHLGKWGGTKLNIKLALSVWGDNDLTELKGKKLGVEEKYKGINSGNAEGFLKDINEKRTATVGLADKSHELANRKDEIKKRFDEIRKELLGGIGALSFLKESIQKKVKAQLEGLKNLGTWQGLDKAHERLLILKDVEDNTETGVGPLEKMGSVEDFQNALDSGMDVLAREEILKALGVANMGQNALTNLEQKILPLINRKKMGSKNEEEIRNLIVGTLESIVENDLNASIPDNIPKILILNRIISKARKN